MTSTDTYAYPSIAQPAAAPAAAQGDRTLSIIALVAGIASVVFGQTFLLPIGAIVVGILGLRREPAGRVMSIWGIVLGSVMLLGWIVVATIGLAVITPFVLFGAFQ